jgi:osmoprotectant transport system substrate-binding protein
VKLLSSLALGTLYVIAVSGCTQVEGASVGSLPTTRSSGIVVGAFNFSESELLAQLYGQALSARGFDVRILDEGAPREVLEPALEQGVIDLVPEYLGTASSWLGFGDAAAGNSSKATHKQLQSLLSERGLRALEFAPAENKNEVVVTNDTATQYNLHTISDLAPVAEELVFGGPPECRIRPLCLVGLESVYGMRFQSFQPLDAGGPLTVAALNGGEVDVALMFTTDAAIGANGLVVLDDDRRLQPAENIVPVVSDALVLRHGAALAQALNSVSERLSPQTLTALNRQIAGGTSPQNAARAWLIALDLGASR